MPLFRSTEGLGPLCPLSLLTLGLFQVFQADSRQSVVYLHMKKKKSCKPVDFKCNFKMCVLLQSENCI